MNRLKSLLYVGIILTVYLLYIKYATFYFFKYALPFVAERLALENSSLVSDLRSFPALYSYQITWFAFILLLGVVIVYLPFSRKLTLKHACSSEPIPWKEWEHAEEYNWIPEMIKNLADAAGISEPKIYITRDFAPNAFAFGGKKGYIIIKEGLLHHLSPDEIKSVLAHEVGHLKQGWLHRSLITVSLAILNYMAIAFKIAAFIFSVIGIAGAGAAANSKNEDEEDIAGGLAVLGIVMGAISLIMFAATVVTVYIVKALNRILMRSDEYDADIKGAQLTDSKTLATALNKLGSYYSSRSESVNPVYSSFFTVNPLRKRFTDKLFDTHPPVHKRIKILEALHEKNAKGTSRLVMFKLKDAIVVIILAIGILFAWKKTGMAYGMKYVTNNNVVNYFFTKYEDYNSKRNLCQKEFKKEIISDQLALYDLRLNVDTKYILKGLQKQYFNRWEVYRKFRIKPRLLPKKIPQIGAILGENVLIPVYKPGELVKYKSTPMGAIYLNLGVIKYRSNLEDVFNVSEEYLEDFLEDNWFYDRSVLVFSMKTDRQLQKFSDDKYTMKVNLEGKLESISFVEFVKRYLETFRRNIAKFLHVSNKDIKIVIGGKWHNDFGEQYNSFDVFLKNHNNRKTPWKYLGEITFEYQKDLWGDEHLEVDSFCIWRNTIYQHFVDYSPNEPNDIGWVPVTKPEAVCSQTFELNLDNSKMKLFESLKNINERERWLAQKGMVTYQSPLIFNVTQN